MDALQELYSHLDHCDNGNLYMSWYGQARAKGMSHDEALADTLTHFNIRSQAWYRRRNLAAK